jgi:hypothetical protein
LTTVATADVAAVEPASVVIEPGTDAVVDTYDETCPFADWVAEDVPVAVPVLLAQTAAVGRFVTPAGMQMLSAYLIVAVRFPPCQDSTTPV